MIGPYRTLASVEPEPPSRCDDAAHPPVCLGRSPRRAIPPELVKALTVAATVFLFAASASLTAIAYSVVRVQAAHVRRYARTHANAVTPPIQERSRPEAAGDHGRGTHAVESVWRHALDRAANGADVTLSRVSLPRALDWTDASAIRVTHDANAGGLRITELGERSPARVAGVRVGDVVTSINGYWLTSPTEAERAFTAVREAESVVAELWRDGRPVVLRVDLRARHW